MLKVMMTKEDSLKQLITPLTEKISLKSLQLNRALWILETTGSSDAADLKASLDYELRKLFSDPVIYKQLLEFSSESSIKSELLKRELNVLIRAFKQNLISDSYLSDISKKEAKLLLSYANFRPTIDNAAVSENDIRSILKTENDPALRKKAWNASKEIGMVLAPQILSLVKTRNLAAKSAGFRDYFQMQLELTEVDEEWLFKTLDELVVTSESAYSNTIEEIENIQMLRFNVPSNELGPWSYSEPFSQEDPLNTQRLDDFLTNTDFLDLNRKFYNNMGIDIEPIIKKSDFYERKGKNQHAFCINMDRASDIRTLNNVQPTIKWLETLLHEFGHAIYELGIDQSLSWTLREPPHMITTEAMALLAGRFAYRGDILKNVIPKSDNQSAYIKEAENGLKRRQLIFSRFVTVMTHFERELYQDPSQDLNKLWWSLVEKYQKIKAPKKRDGKQDWAAKYHIGLAPVYYYSYLLGELFASKIEETILQRTGIKGIDHVEAGKFLKDKLFFPGNKMRWNDLIVHVTGSELTADSWINQFT